MLSENRQFLMGQQIWLIDGTFKSAPPEFEQIITIVGVATYPNPMYVPCVHIYMNGKSQADYSRMLSILFNYLIPYDRCSVRKVVIDFEAAMRNALIETTRQFGREVMVKGCLFHYGQVIYRYYVQNIPQDSPQNRRYCTISCSFHIWTSP